MQKKKITKRSLIEKHLLDKQDSEVVYKRGKKYRTKIVPAPWAHVIMVAGLSAFAVNVVRLAIINTFGEPEIFKYNSRLEADYKTQQDLPKE